MKKYVVITNVWGKKYNNHGYFVDTFKEEREYFDTMDEVNEYVSLFENICSDYKIPTCCAWNDETSYTFKDPDEHLWGYVIGNTEKLSIVKWGGIKMYNIKKSTKKLYLRDYVFRGPDEIPENYKWDEGEYEGWLQFRWGDGKNAVGYVEKKAKKPKMVKQDDFVENDPAYDFSDEIEDMYAKIDERLKLSKY